MRDVRDRTAVRDPSVAATLDLDPDGSLLDFADDALFGIRFGHDPSITYRTMGDVYDTVIALVGNAETRSGPCGSVLVFNRLRRALEIRVPGSIKPSMPLANLAPRSPAALFRRIAKDAGLRLPVTDQTAIGVIGGFALLGSICLLALGLFGGAGLQVAGIGLLAAATGGLLLWIDPGRLPTHLTTVGDLVRHTAPLNRQVLESAGVRIASADPWETLVALAADHAAISMDRIGQETTLVRGI